MKKLQALKMKLEKKKDCIPVRMEIRKNSILNSDE